MEESEKAFEVKSFLKSKLFWVANIFFLFIIIATISDLLDTSGMSNFLNVLVSGPLFGILFYSIIVDVLILRYVALCASNKSGATTAVGGRWLFPTGTEEQKLVWRKAMSEFSRKKIFLFYYILTGASFALWMILIYLGY